MWLPWLFATHRSVHEPMFAIRLDEYFRGVDAVFVFHLRPIYGLLRGQIRVRGMWRGMTLIMSA